jgi:hypothetical protein
VREGEGGGEGATLSPSSVAAVCFTYTPLLHEETETTRQVIVPSISPSLDQLLHKEVQTLPYLQEKYGAHVAELMDEFDLLSDEERDLFVAERSSYLLSQVRQSSAYYARTLSSNTLSSAPTITGHTLLEVNSLYA